MAQNGIVVDTGASSVAGMDLKDFFRNAGLVQSALESMKASARSFGSGIQRAGRGFVRMADYAKGLVSALMQASNLAQGLETGLMNLYRWGRGAWRSFSGALDSLATSALYLRNSLGAMVAPLVQALAPAINYVTNKFVDLFNVVNQVFARLTGSKTYVAAKRVSDTWDSTAGRISRAASALKRYISGFDQLNVLTDGSGGGSSSGGGGGGGASDMFETREIEGGLSDFVDALKSAFQAGDWQELGTLLGEKVNQLVESVDWAGLGQKVGYYVNGLFSTAYWTLDTVNFENIGASVAEFLNNALAQVDFSKVGGSVALLVTSFFETVAGFVATFDWGQFAGKLAEGLNGFAFELGSRLDAIDWAGLALRLTEGVNTFIAKTDWALLGSTLAGRFNDLLAILGTAAAKFDWSGAGKALANSINALFKRVDWEGLGEWLNNTLLGVLDFGLAFLNGFDAAGFADGVGKALARVDWNAVSRKLWQLFSTALKKLGEFVGTLLLGGSADLSLNLSLLKNGWTTVLSWLGIDKPLPALISLAKNKWTTIAAFVGTAVKVLTTLGKDGWSSIGKFVGTAVKVYTSLKKNKWSTIAKFVGNAVTVSTSLKKSGWSSILKFVTGNSSGKVGISLTLNSVASALKSVASKLGIKLATGGIVTNAGGVRRFASGGVISGGLARYLGSVPHYASGTTRAHGTVFVAGEAGPEIMGHINGRTEILNKSQLAQTMYAAVYGGMVAALRGLTFRMPAMATGTVMPYEVAAQVARTGEDIQNTLNANNEDLIQTIISVAAQIVAAMQTGGRPQQTGPIGGLTAQQLINDINRRTQMFGVSPLTGV